MFNWSPWTAITREEENVDDVIHIENLTCVLGIITYMNYKMNISCLTAKLVIFLNKGFGSIIEI